MRPLEPSALWHELPMFPLQARTVEFITHGKSGKLEDRMTGDTIQVVASSAGKAVVEVDPGLGKSRIAIGCCLELAPQKRILVICSKKALNTWRREFPKWTNLPPEELVVIEGTPAQRRKLWAIPSRVKVITYQSGLNDLEKVKKFNAHIVISDECKIMRNYKSKTFKGWAPYLRKVTYYIPMDGTLVVNGPQDLWTFLNIMNPKLFSSYWKYVNTFCEVVDGGWGKEIIGAKNTKAWAKAMSTRLVRIKDSDPGVADQRPPLVRDFKFVRMTKEQSGFYRAIADDMMAITPGGVFVATPTQLAAQVKHRQILICPKIIDPTLGYGAAIEHLLDNMEDDPHVVIFTPFAKALPFLVKAVESRGYPTPFVLKGGTHSEEVQRVVEGFNGPGGRETATICTIAFAESFELWSAKSCHFIGYDWRQDLNYQAEKRLHRLITPHPITSWYYRYEGTVDDDILDRLNSHVRGVKITYQDYITAVQRLKDVG